MRNLDKDKEIQRLRALLKKKNAMIKDLRITIKELTIALENEDEYVVEQIHDISAAEKKSKNSDDDDDDVPIDVVKHIKEIFGDEVKCQVCSSTGIEQFSFCTACGIGWAYCDKCGGFEKAQEENRKHIVPTHGPFFDMFDKNEENNNSSKSN